MLKRAISQGVDEKDLAAVLKVRVDRIRQTRDLPENLIPKARELLESNIIFRSTAEQLKRVTEERQHEILEKMKELNNYSSSYAKVLVMKSPEEMRRKPDVGNPDKPDSSKKRLYTEIRKGDEEIEFNSQRYKQDIKELMKQVVFFRTPFGKRGGNGVSFTELPSDGKRGAKDPGPIGNRGFILKPKPCRRRFCRR